MNELRTMMVQFRARHNLSQEKAARAADISLQTWNSVEQGRQDPSRLTQSKILLAIADYDQKAVKA